MLEECSSLITTDWHLLEAILLLSEILITMVLFYTHLKFLFQVFIYVFVSRNYLEIFFPLRIPNRDLIGIVTYTQEYPDSKMESFVCQISPATWNFQIKVFTRLNTLLTTSFLPTPKKSIVIKMELYFGQQSVHNHSIFFGSTLKKEQ